MKSNLHIQLMNGKSKRTSILMSAKIFMQQLQESTALKKIRSDKNNQYMLLEKIFSDIKLALHEVNAKDLPMIHVMGKKFEEVEEVKKEKPIIQNRFVDQKELKLAQELEDIERKLASL